MRFSRQILAICAELIPGVRTLGAGGWGHSGSSAARLAYHVSVIRNLSSRPKGDGQDTYLRETATAGVPEAATKEPLEMIPNEREGQRRNGTGFEQNQTQHSLASPPPAPGEASHDAGSAAPLADTGTPSPRLATDAATSSPAAERRGERLYEERRRLLRGLWLDDAPDWRDLPEDVKERWCRNAAS